MMEPFYFLFSTTSVLLPTFSEAGTPPTTTPVTGKESPAIKITRKLHRARDFRSLTELSPWANSCPTR
ncbi:hypothetical protein SUGI_0034070 [Cryptomeria japonica]|nr:hypothetical protein SUGI_0034070 [Cryptomeria japonica]